MSKASQVLHLTQPTLTHNMQALEVLAGGRLFERSRLGVRSTALGEVLAREGRAITRRIRDANEACARHRGGFRNTIRLGTGPLIGAALVPGLLLALCAGDHRQALSVQSDRPHLLLDQLVDGRHDFVIAPTWLDKPPPGIERFLLIEDQIGVFCGKDHPAVVTGKPKVQTNWLSMSAASPFDQNVRDMLAGAGVDEARSSATVMGDTQMLFRILAQGRHLSVLPRYPLKILGPTFGLVEIDLAVRPTARDIYLWCRKELLEEGALVEFKDLLLAYARSKS